MKDAYSVLQGDVIVVKELMAMLESQHPGKLLWTLQGTEWWHIIDWFHRQIFDNACAVLNKTLPELKTGFAGRKNWPVHIFAWHTIFNIHQRTVFLGSFWLCMVLVLTRVTKKLLMLHYMSFWSAYWWKKKKTEALLGSLKHQYVDRTYYGSTSLCWFAAVSLASICWF